MASTANFGSSLGRPEGAWISASYLSLKVAEDVFASSSGPSTYGPTTTPLGQSRPRARIRATASRSSFASSARNTPALPRPVQGLHTIGPDDGDRTENVVPALPPQIFGRDFKPPADLLASHQSCKPRITSSTPKQQQHPISTASPRPLSADSLPRRP
ncbi:hypothetical protein PoMZ_04863 [Pyricularia oryzae]|uniref:Uncharacterized protein n=1 Tax=Pyricularia oryzae TaxID=318829 RepID=A0A4P7NAQ5_PYROR|nr:hypothetical protein PoMZ_04863 [Pyricularia oryzae]